MCVSIYLTLACHPMGLEFRLASATSVRNKKGKYTSVLEGGGMVNIYVQGYKVYKLSNTCMQLGILIY